MVKILNQDKKIWFKSYSFEFFKLVDELSRITAKKEKGYYN